MQKENEWVKFEDEKPKEMGCYDVLISDGENLIPGRDFYSDIRGIFINITCVYAWRRNKKCVKS